MTHHSSQQQQNQHAEKLRTEYIQGRKRPFPEVSISEGGDDENEMKKLHSDFNCKFERFQNYNLSKIRS